MLVNAANLIERNLAFCFYSMVLITHSTLAMPAPGNIKPDDIHEIIPVSADVSQESTKAIKKIILGGAALLGAPFQWSQVVSVIYFLLFSHLL